MKQLYIMMVLSLSITHCTSKQVQPSITGHWQITAIASVTGETEKAPALTVFSFNKDSFYSLYYANVIKYTGTYSLHSATKTLYTTYTLNNNILYDTAYIVQLTDTLMMLKENRENGDTIKFRKRSDEKKI